MSHIIFRAPLTCTNCGSLNDERSNQLYTAGIGHEAGDTRADRGDVLDLEVVDFEDGYFTLRRLSREDTTVIALELWGCRVCGRIQAARLHFERVDELHWRFEDARVVPLSSTFLEEAHFISRRLEEWAPNPGDDADRVWEIVHKFELKP